MLFFGVFRITSVGLCAARVSSEAPREPSASLFSRASSPVSARRIQFQSFALGGAPDAQFVNAMAEDRDGSLLAGTNRGFKKWWSH